MGISKIIDPGSRHIISFTPIRTASSQDLPGSLSFWQLQDEAITGFDKKYPVLKKISSVTELLFS